VSARIRRYVYADERRVVELSLRAWAPIFESLERELGHELFVRLHGDWREYQDAAVREVLGDSANQIWVAEGDQDIVGFAAATLHQDRQLGEIVMVAVDVVHQGRGVGSALTSAATAWLRDSGMRVAMVETGGDPGHASARRLYEQAHYTRLSIARYFKVL
jgi:ribosomal protein S18 acetylase RimI-like enzyme